MTKYFAKDCAQFPEFNRKVKAGEIVELDEKLAAQLNGLKPGTLEKYVPEKHTPKPRLDGEGPAAGEKKDDKKADDKK